MFHRERYTTSSHIEAYHARRAARDTLILRPPPTAHASAGVEGPPQDPPPRWPRLPHAPCPTRPPPPSTSTLLTYSIYLSRLGAVHDQPVSRCRPEVTSQSAPSAPDEEGSRHSCHPAEHASTASLRLVVDSSRVSVQPVRRRSVCTRCWQRICSSASDVCASGGGGVFVCVVVVNAHAGGNSGRKSQGCHHLVRER